MCTWNVFTLQTQQTTLAHKQMHKHWSSVSSSQRTPSSSSQSSTSSRHNKCAHICASVHNNSGDVCVWCVGVHMFVNRRYEFARICRALACVSACIYIFSNIIACTTTKCGACRHQRSEGRPDPHSAAAAAASAVAVSSPKGDSLLIILATCERVANICIANILRYICDWMCYITYRMADVSVIYSDSIYYFVAFFALDNFWIFAADSYRFWMRYKLTLLSLSFFCKTILNWNVHYTNSYKHLNIGHPILCIHPTIYIHTHTNICVPYIQSATCWWTAATTTTGPTDWRLITDLGWCACCFCTGLYLTGRQETAKTRATTTTTDEHTLKWNLSASVAWSSSLSRKNPTGDNVLLYHWDKWLLLLCFEHVHTHFARRTIKHARTLWHWIGPRLARQPHLRKRLSSCAIFAFVSTRNDIDNDVIIIIGSI